MIAANVALDANCQAFQNCVKKETNEVLVAPL